MPDRLWDHDQWEVIYSVEDTKVKAALVALYRLILSMRETDVFAQRVADQISRRDRVIFSRTQKFFSGLLFILVLVDTVMHIIHGG